MMWTKQLLRADVLIAFAILAAGCGAPIIAETTAGSVEQPVDTTSTMDIQGSIAEGTVAGPVKGLTSSTVADMTTTSSSTLEYSPAWIEWQDINTYLDFDSLESTKIAYDYMSGNPNEISTPMGALCWSFYELSRSIVMGLIRWILDDHIIPYSMEEYSVSSEQVGDSGPEATEAFLDLIFGDSGAVGSIDTGAGGQTALPGDNGGTGLVGSTGEVDNGNDSDLWESLRLDHEFAGDGTEWSNAVRAVAAPEMVTAFQASEGLPPDVQVYADALVAFARERVSRELDLSVETSDIDFQEPSFPGIAAFVEAANYRQDCKRVWIDDITGNVESSSAPTTTTTTAPPAVSTTTTIQQTVEDTSPSTTSVTAPPSVTDTRPLEDQDGRRIEVDHVD